MLVKGISLFGCFFISLYGAYKEEKVIICGVGKNIQSQLPHMIKKIESLGKSFQDYQVVIYENNSTDGTQEALAAWAQKNSKVHIISEMLSSVELYKRTKIHAQSNKAPCRIELIAYARNKTLTKAFEAAFNDFNFLVMTDLDFYQGWTIDGVLSCFKHTFAWDCMAANGIDSNGLLYDRYAYRSRQFPLGPELLGEKFWDDIKKHSFALNPNTHPFKVYSAFGGIAVYKKQALKNCFYSGSPTKNFQKFLFTLINIQVPKKNNHYQLYKKIVQKKLTALPVVFQANSGYDGPTVCEHSTLHAAMALNGYDKIYVNPAMICRY